MHLNCNVSPNSKEADVGSSDQVASTSSGKNTGVVLRPCCAWRCVPAAISSGMDIYEVPEYHLLQQISFQ